MSEQLVTVEIDTNGNVYVDLVGFKGKGCKEVANAFNSLGKVNKEETKPEYYEGPAPGGGVYIGR